MIRVKICGITRPEDGVAAAASGADAIGLVFWPGSKRHVTPEQGAAIVAALPPFITVVGLFVNATGEAIRATAARCPIDVFQLHGDEPPQACRGLPGRVIKALRVAEAADLTGWERYPVNGLLLDAKVSGHYGGTGSRFDWSILAGPVMQRPVILAGGLDPDNVADAVTRVRPYGVDVSSGVESAPGIKDHHQMERFVREARRAAAALPPTSQRAYTP